MKNFYLKHEKAIIAIFLTVSLTGIFYYLDYYNYSLFKAGYKFYVLENFIDKRIPLIPEFYWIYILYYPLCFSPIFILKDIEIYRRVALSFFLEFFISFIIFLTIPVRMVQPDISGTSLNEIALKKLYNFDPGFNVFPSLHVANMILITFIFYEFSKFWGHLFLVFTILISLSTMLVKQHYFWDIPSGVLLGWIVFYIVFEKDIIKNLILKESKYEKDNRTEG